MKKIKLFGDMVMDQGALENDVNEFITDPDIIVEDIQMSSGTNYISIMVVYREK